MVVAQSPNTATTKPSVVAPKPTVKPVPKPVMPPATVAKPKPVAPSATAAKPKPVAPSATVAKPRPVAPPKTVARPKPVAPKVIVSPAAWKTYTNGAYGFVAGYPGTAKVRNESSHMKPKGPGSFWIAFTQTSSGKPWYAINVRHMKTNDPGSPDKFAKYNQYLLSWDRTNVAGLDGFKTVSGRASSKRVIHRTLLVDDRDVWMLNLTDVSGNDPIITGEIFKRFVDSFRPEGSVGGGHPVPVTPVRPAPMLRTGHPTPPPPAMAPAPVPAPEPAPEAPPPPSPYDGGYDSGE
jgi:hypothetical protein